MEFALIILIPFIGTTLGAAMVFLLRKSINPKLEKILIGFAAGVMIAASIWSLILPSIELTEISIKWLPAAVGFAAGMIFLLLLDTYLPHQHIKEDEPEGVKTNLGKSKLLFLSVTLHNIPEGMAVGALLAGFITNNEHIGFAAALSLSIGIAIQNFPEGAIISMPLRSTGLSKPKSFWYGFLSGAVEPIAALLMVLLVKWLNPLLPYFLSFAAGAMIYVVVEELIPESQSGHHSNLATIGVMVGFIVMMVLDIALS